MRKVGGSWVGSAVAAGALALGAGGCLSVDLSALLDSSLQEVQVEAPASRKAGKLLIVDISGVIMTGSAGLFDEDDACSPDHVKAILNKAGQDPRIRGVILRIDSPGGAVAESDTIYHEIRAFRQRTGLPVMAAVMGLGCSGAYYVACGADRIYAHPASLVGSIGVIGTFHKLRGLADKVGYDQVVVKSGAMKDMGNPFREMPAEEREVLQGIIDAYYSRFLDTVAAGRPALADREKLKAIADGRVYAPQQALELKLVDSVAYLDEVIAEARKAAGLEDAAVVTYVRGGGGDDANIYTARAARTLRVGAPAFDPRALTGGLRAGFHYLWMPGAL